MLRAAATGNPSELAVYFRDLVPTLLRNLPSPLAAPYLVKLFIELRKCAFEKSDDVLGTFHSLMTFDLKQLVTLLRYWKGSISTSCVPPFVAKQSEAAYGT